MVNFVVQNCIQFIEANTYFTKNFYNFVFGNQGIDIIIIFIRMIIKYKDTKLF